MDKTVFVKRDMEPEEIDEQTNELAMHTAYMIFGFFSALLCMGQDQVKIKSNIDSLVNTVWDQFRERVEKSGHSIGEIADVYKNGTDEEYGKVMEEVMEALGFSEENTDNASRG